MKIQGIAGRIAALPVIGGMARRVRLMALRWGAPFVIRHYLREHPAGKLHLGAGGSGLPGWLNTDLFPERWPTVRLDVTRTFPLPNGEFSCVFSEHMIEHIPLAAGRHMLRECHRVLSPGGLIRIATPDLARVTELYRAEGRTAQSYAAWAVRHNRLPLDLPADVVVINSLFHDHGHRFLYDETALAAVLTSCGFSDIRRQAPGESGHSALRGLEVHHMPIGHEANNFETLILEARKA